jgi:hypothetical protein
VDTTGQRIKLKREKVDVIEEETEYQDGGLVSIYKHFPLADLLMKDLIKGSSSLAIATVTRA